METQVSVVVISPDRSARNAIASALDSRVGTLFSHSVYPHPSRLAEFPLPPGGCVLFLDFSESLPATAIAQTVDASLHGVSIVALYNGKNPRDLLNLMRLGVREIVVGIANPTVLR